MTIEELAKKYWPQVIGRRLTSGDRPGIEAFDMNLMKRDIGLAFARELVEQCAQIAEKHGHETASIEGSRSAEQIASEIRALAGERK